MEKKLENVLNLIKAARLERPLMTFSSILLIAGIANKINTEIFILLICSLLMYSVGGIINSKADNDFKLRHTNLIIFILFFISLILSLYNYIIFFTVLASIFLGFIYSKFSRYVLFGDSIVLSLVHTILPILSASLLLNFDLISTIKLSIVFFVSFALITPMKNLRGVEEDKKMGYKTLMTLYKNGKKITNFFLQFYFILLFLSYFIFDLGDKFLLVILGIFLIKILIDYYMNNNREVRAYHLCRLIVMLFAFAFVYDRATNLSIVFLSLLIPIIYVLYLLTNKTGS